MTRLAGFILLYFLTHHTLATRPILRALLEFPSSAAFSSLSLYLAMSSCRAVIVPSTERPPADCKLGELSVPAVVDSAAETADGAATAAVLSEAVAIMINKLYILSQCTTYKTINDEIITKTARAMYVQIRLWGCSNSFYIFTADQISDICDKVDHSEKFN